jgi:hypothetical protein
VHACEFACCTFEGEIYSLTTVQQWIYKHNLSFKTTNMIQKEAACAEKLEIIVQKPNIFSFN